MPTIHCWWISSASRVAGLKHLGWQAFAENVPQRLDRLAASGAMGPVIAAFPDCFTSLGGNQYVNSVATGNWEDFLLDEMIPRIEGAFRVRRGAAHRAVFGKSSGGYGSIMQGLRHGDRWAAVACHSGDINFDVVYRRDLPLATDELARHDGSVEKFFEHLRGADKLGSGEMHALMVLAMAATYDPDPSSTAGSAFAGGPRYVRAEPRTLGPLAGARPADHSSNGPNASRACEN